MTLTRRDRWIAAGATLFCFGVYTAFLSKNYVFEGLLRALPMETGRWVHLFAGNYLLYGPLGLSFHTLLRFLGVQQLAVDSLQIMDALIGSLGVGLFYLLQRRLGQNRVMSLSWAGVLAFSLGYWLWSTDAENYIFSTLLLMTLFYLLVRFSQGEAIDPVTLGFFHGVAVLGHIVNLIMGGVVVWFLLQRYGRKVGRPIARYLVALLMVAGGAYLSVIWFIQKPASAELAWQWFKGSAGTQSTINLGGSFTLHKFSEWTTMSAHIIGSFRPAYVAPPALPLAALFLAGVWALLGFFVTVLGVRLRALIQHERVLAVGCLLWLGLYALMFTRWEPWTMVYRVSDLVPCVVLLSLAYRGVAGQRLFSPAVPALWAVCLFLGNSSAEIIPRSYASNNPQLARMEFIRTHTPETAWVAGEGRYGEIHLPYFAQRRPIVIDRFAQDPERLAIGLDQLLQQHEVIYVPSNILELKPWKEFFKRYRLEAQAQQEGSEFTLYRLRR